MFHSRLRGIDLHAPSNQVVINGHTSYIPKNTVVKIKGVSQEGIPIIEPVTSVADNPFGLTWDDILVGKTGLICIFGIFPYSNSGVSGDNIYFTNQGNISLVKTNSPIIGKILSDSFLHINMFVSVEEDLNWNVRGNIVENNFKLGSVNDKGFDIITNNETRIHLSSNGQIRFGDNNLIPDFKYQISNNIPHHSGVLIENISVENPLQELNVFSYKIQENTLQVFNIHLLAKNGNKKGIFDYTVSVSRNSGTAILHHVQTDYFFKLGDSSFKVNFYTHLDYFKIKVYNPDELNTVWSGYILSHALL